MSPKILLLTAANASGKSYILDAIQHADAFREFTIFEMDSLEYYVPERLDGQLPIALELFRRWCASKPRTETLARLESTVLEPALSADDRARQLIKLKLVELAAARRPVFSINPRVLHDHANGALYYQRLAEYFAIRIRHVLVHPSLLRYRANWMQRQDTHRMRAAFATRRYLYSIAGTFDDVFHPRLLTRASHVERFFRRQIST